MSFKVRALRDQYLADTGYSAASYSAPRFSISMGKYVISMRNPGMLQYHDLHHVVSGYGTGLVDEARVSIYELRGGCPSALILLLCLGAIGIGLLLSPASVFRAWRIARGTRNLYASALPFENLLDLDVRKLRESLGIPPEGFKEQKYELRTQTA